MAIRQFHRFLAARGLAADDPTAGMRLPKYRQRIPEPLSVEEMRRLLDAPMELSHHHARMGGMLLYATGMRISEATGLRMDQLNLGEGCVRVLGKGGKERVLPIRPRAKEALARYLEARQGRFPGRQGPVFLTSRGGPVSRSTFWQQLRALARRAGISGRVTPHVLRHSATGGRGVDSSDPGVAGPLKPVDDNSTVRACLVGVPPPGL